MEKKERRPSKSLSERLAILEGRGVYIPDENIGKEILSNISYYSLVNMNKDIFCTDPKRDVYRNNISITNMYYAHLAQKAILTIFLKYIIICEETFKTVLAEIISDEFGDEFKEVTIPENNYLYFKHYYGDNRQNTCKKILDQIKFNISKRQSSGTYYYHTTKAHIPAWIAIRDLYFSLAFRWYKILSSAKKDSVINSLIKISPRIKSKLFSNKELTKEFFSCAIDILIDSRNAIAHGNKPYPYLINSKIPKKSVEILFPEKYNIEQLHNNGFCDQDYVALALSVLVILFNNQLKLAFIEELEAQINVYQNLDYGDLSFYDVVSMPSEFLTILRDLYDFLKLES